MRAEFTIKTKEKSPRMFNVTNDILLLNFLIVSKEKKEKLKKGRELSHKHLRKS